MDKIPVLCYHRVCPKEEIGSDSRSLCVTPEQFNAQMSLLKWLGYKTVTPQHLAAYFKGQKNMHKKAVLISFDDGYQDNFKYAFPILKKYSFTAAIFLVTNGIGGKNSWDSGSQTLLSEAEISQMQSEGIVFGSHTENHIDLSKTETEQIKRELENSKKKVEAITQRFDLSFCYPYSRLREDSRDLVREAGYLCAFGGDRCLMDHQTDLFEIPRIQIFPSTSLFGFWKKIQRWYPGFMQFQKKIKSILNSKR